MALRREGETVRRLAAIPGVGPAIAARLVSEGYTSRAQIRGSPAALAGLPPEARVAMELDISEKVPLEVAAAIAAELGRRLRFPASEGRGAKTPPVRLPVVPVGGVRRGAPWQKDVDLLVVTRRSPARIGGLLAGAFLAPRREGDRARIAASYASGTRRRSLVVGWGPGPTYVRVDLFLATNAEKPFALFHFTGGKMYNVRTRAHAKRQGLLLNQYGLFGPPDRTGARRRIDTVKGAKGKRRIRTERDLARALGVTYRPPGERSG